MSFQTLAAWLRHFEDRSTHEIELGLTRIRSVALSLDLLQPKAEVITVAGTNGKGSTVAMIEAIYIAAGLRVGAYTSPHLIHFNERIRINQVMASDASLCDAFWQIENARGSTHLTYFEMATLAALLLFRTAEVDVMILEVGIGGRLDATNIIDASLAIVTTIDFDHMDYLGHTLEAIGAEKAGIFKPNQKAIYADFSPPRSVIEAAALLKIPLIRLQHDYSYEILEECFIVRFGELLFHLPRSKLHPHAVAAGIIAANLLMDRLPIQVQFLEKAIQNVRITGRQQVIYDTICTVFDVAHNPQAVKLLADRIKLLQDDNPNAQVHAVFSGLSDKDLESLVRLMQYVVDEWHTAVLESVRAASAHRLKELWMTIASPKWYSSIVDAFYGARRSALPGDIIVVYGSFHVVGPVMASLEQ